MKEFKKNWAKLITVYWIIEVLLMMFFYPIIPKLLNYPKAALNLPFQSKVDVLTYNEQFSMILLTLIFIVAIFLIIRYFYIKPHIKVLSNSKSSEDKKGKAYLEVIHILKRDPITLYILQVFIPLAMVVLYFTCCGNSFEVIIKHFIVYGTILITIATISFILAKIILKNILVNYFYLFEKNDSLIGKSVKDIHRFSIKKSVCIAILPIFFVLITIITLIASANNSQSQGNLKQQLYSDKISSIIDKSNNSYAIDVNYTLSRIEDDLKNIEYVDTDDTYFIIDKSNYSVVRGNELSTFFKEYVKNINSTDRIYDYYSSSYQGVAKEISLGDNTYLIGIRYTISSRTMVKSIITASIVVLIFAFVSFVISLNYIFGDIKILSNKLKSIANKSKKLDLNEKIPVLSNNEISDITLSYNSVQDKTKDYITQIEDDQSSLMERERLATLGQMIGGVAHNMKTPIMSIAGAADGMDDLIKEYEQSIDDPEVKPDDHKQIAHEMDELNNKIKTYNTYMSDIITAVKGQAVNMNQQDSSDEFTIDELLTRVNILMKHELKVNLVSLNVDLKVDKKDILKGNINSLVQVINNLIGNAIQSYETINSSIIDSDNPVDTSNRIIDLSISKNDTSFVITVKDYGCGIPKDIQDKLFKVMVTTKGHNGSGLGLFMSYSTIKGNFKGDLTFKSKVGEGTEFTITLPRK